MWEFDSSLVTPANRERVWELWTDISAWPEFNPGIRQASLEGPFGPGAVGSSRASGGPPSKLRVVTVEPGHMFVTETPLPLATLRFEHRIEPADDGRLMVTMGVRMTGPATPFFRRVIGPRLEASVPEALRNLSELATTGNETHFVETN